MFRALILLSLTCICKAGDYPTRYVVASPDVAVSQKCIQTLETALAAVDSNTGRHFQLVLIKGGNVEAQADSLFQEWGWGELKIPVGIYIRTFRDNPTKWQIFLPEMVDR